MGKTKSKKRKHSSDSSEYSSSSSDSESDTTKEKRKLHKLKKKLKKEQRKTEKLLKKKLKKEKHRLKKEQRSRSKSNGRSRETSQIHEASADIPIELMEKSKAMAPMTKEEWEKRQSIVRRVLDDETGRYRLIKGDGEVLEEIVSRDRHKEINKIATQADGAFFQLNTAGKPIL